MLTIAAPLAPHAAGLARVIFFSSHNVTIHADAPVYRALAQAEEAVSAAAPHALFLRPTLIYGDPRLALMTRLVRLVRRFPIVPSPGDAHIKLQPIYHEDLAAIAAHFCEDASCSGSVAIGGAETVTKPGLLRAIARAIGRPRLIAPAPAALVRAASAVAAAIGARFPLDAAQIDRLDYDRTAPDPPAGAPRATTPLAEGLRRLIARMDAAPPAA